MLTDVPDGFVVVVFVVVGVVLRKTQHNIL